MKRLELLLPLLVAALLSPAFARADDPEGYCKTGPNSPECYCLAQPAHASELKCLRFLGANPGFSSKGAGTSATFNSGAKAPAPTVQAPPALVRPSDYILFLHHGAASDAGNPPNVSSLVKKLKEDGYVVRGTDDQRDVSGSGIDYFRQEDKDAAQIIANLVNKWLKENDKRELPEVKPRRQDARNPPGYLGVWIFGHPAKQ